MIRELRTLVAVARRGSFAAAGEQVGLTQSAVSAQIRALERSVGVELFQRTPRAAHLNEAGRQAVRTAEQILALFDGIGQGDSPRGRLRIGAVNTAQTRLLPEVLKRLAEQAPHIEPQVVPGVSLHLLDQVDAAELDLAILIRPPFNLPRGLFAQRVERQPFVLIAPPQCTATDALELLRTQPFIRYDHVSFGGRLVGDFLEAQQLRPRQVMELDEIDAIARMVENGLGVALLPRAGLWLREPARVRVIELGALEFQRELVMVSRSGSAQDDLVGEFRRALLAETAAQEAAPTTA